MNRIEKMRYNLYKALDGGNVKQILKLSRQLDKYIVEIMKANNKSLLR